MTAQGALRIHSCCVCGNRWDLSGTDASTLHDLNMLLWDTHVGILPGQEHRVTARCVYREGLLPA